MALIRSFQKSLQRWEDVVSDVHNCTLKETGHGTPERWRSLLEDYVELHRALHVHLWLRSDIGELPRGDYCIVFESAGSAPDHDRASFDLWPTECDASRGTHNASHNDVAMFVDIGEVTDNGQWIAKSRHPSIVRLQRLNRGLRVGMHEAESSVASSVELGGAIANEELHPLRLFVGQGSGVLRGESVRDTVERASQTVEDVAYAETPIVGDWFHHLQACGVLAFFRVLLSDEMVGVAIEKNPDGVIERIEVLLGPLQFSQVVH
jgi:hypothetical protein